MVPHEEAVGLEQNEVSDPDESTQLLGKAHREMMEEIRAVATVSVPRGARTLECT